MNMITEETRARKERRFGRKIRVPNLVRVDYASVSSFRRVVLQ